MTRRRADKKPTFGDDDGASLELVKMLVIAKADPGQGNGGTGESALHVASEAGDEAVSPLIIPPLKEKSRRRCWFRGFDLNEVRRVRWALR